MRDGFWRWLLRAAAAYNLAVAVPAMLAPGAASGDRIASLLIACFGVLYAIVSRDPARLAPALWAGVIGKVGIAGMMLPAVIAGTAPAGTGAVLAGDMMFTAGFIALLLRTGGRREPG